VDPYRRLAAAVMTRAIKDYALWHSEEGKAFRRALRAVERRDDGEVAAREWQKFGYNTAKRSFIVLAQLHQFSEPGRFLRTDTPYHRILDLDPELFEEWLAKPEWVERAASVARNAGRIEPDYPRRRVSDKSLKNLKQYQ